MSAASLARRSRALHRAAAPGGPRELPERSKEVYGATLPFLKCGAEAPFMGAGSHERRGSALQKLHPRGSAAGGATGAFRRWSL